MADKSNRNILVNMLNALFDVGINYNEYTLGEYSYWIDGPIWKLGEPITVTEKSRNGFKEPKTIL